MEDIQVPEFFAGAHIEDGLSGDGLCRQRRTTAGIAVQLCEDDTVNADLVVEGGCHVDSVLTGHGVDDEKYICRMDRRFDVLQFLHKGLIHVETACRINKYEVISLVFGVGDGLFGYFNRVPLAALKDRNPRLFADDLQLLDGGRAIDVSGYEQRTVALVLQSLCDFCTMGGLTGTLQPAHHDDCGRMTCGHEAGLCSAHEVRQFLVDDLDDHLCRGQALHDLLADGSLRYLLGEVLGDLIGDVGFQKGETHFTHGALYVRLGQSTFALQRFECRLKAVGQTFKCHIVSSSVLSVIY